MGGRAWRGGVGGGRDRRAAVWVEGGGGRERRAAARATVRGRGGGGMRRSAYEDECACLGVSPGVILKNMYILIEYHSFN